MSLNIFKSIWNIYWVYYIILRVIYYIEGGLGSALGHVTGIHAELYNNLLQ